MKYYTLCCVIFLSLAPHTSVLGQNKADKDLIDQSLVSDIRTWLSVPVVEIALSAQNIRHSDLNAQEINELDTRWRHERDAQDQPLIASTLNNPLSTYLTQIQAMSGGLFTEIFVMDARGLNAGQSAITSDFWQGDEAKFQKTYEVSSNAIFIDEPELHEATGTWRSQLNITLTNQQGQSIGAATVEINLTELARRKTS